MGQSMVQHVTVAGEKVTGVLRKPFKIIVTNIVCSEFICMINTFYFCKQSYFHAADIIYIEFLMKIF